MGQAVYVVHDGVSAVDATARFDPSIVFIDLSMPGIDGYETARRIRALPGSEARRLIALTGYGLATVESRMRESGLISISPSRRSPPISIVSLPDDSRCECASHRSSATP